jgi:hypothetical protein
MNIHMKYPSPSTYHSKVVAEFKVFWQMTEGQTGQKQYAPYLRSWGHKNGECIKKMSHLFVSRHLHGTVARAAAYINLINYPYVVGLNPTMRHA